MGQGRQGETQIRGKEIADWRNTKITREKPEYRETAADLSEPVFGS